ncbi:hypothetical protein [Corynebacterium auriscanis]|uniref:Uncharacterized protein n=1 Tax=Corynebacterium auriscanis TaxID=99807 RepID=A0A0A2DFY1_9CORY|nr:hypothetical protein [Corynebacterium auriscanis]KGM18070.1 hypothetical protein MA47_10460 [Corynebacterium auriscanis]WJY73815.1 hypothetical protein CAURIC_11135 [Corynebacterium auriscanis]
MPSLTSKIHRGSLRPALAIAVALGSATAMTVVPSTVAQEAQTTNKTITAKCKTSDLPLVGAQEIALTDPVKVAITSPQDVKEGEAFEVKVKIDPISIDMSSLPSGVSLQQASRLKMDLVRPTNLQLESFDLKGGNLPIDGAKIITVNEQGKEDPQGTILRFTDAGHNTTGNGPNSATNSHAGLGMDLRNKKSIDLQFPEVTLRFKATAPGTATVGLRTKGAAATLGNPADAITVLATANAPLIGTAWASAGCVPAGDADNLLTINVAAIPATPTQTELTQPEQILVGRPAAFTAKVTPGAAGKVRFTAGTNSVVADVDPQTGQATANLTFDEAKDTPVTAVFEPAVPKEFASSQAELTVTPVQLQGKLEITAPQIATAQKAVEVAVNTPAGAKGQVAITTSDGQERRIPVTDGGQARARFTFSTPGEVTIKAALEASSNSPTTAPPAETKIQVEAADRTGLTINGQLDGIKVGDKRELTATVTPAPNTTDTKGVVHFIVDGQRKTAPVTDGVAKVEHVFTRTGDITLKATYVPAADSEQTRAEEQMTVTVVAASSTAQATLTGEANVYAGAQYSYDFTVIPAANGKVRIFVGDALVARDIAVEEGKARATIDIPADLMGQSTIRAEFIREGESKVSARATHPVTVVANADVGAINSELTSATQEVKAGEALPVRFEARPENADADMKRINGYLELTSNGSKVEKDGQPVRIPVVHGVADMNVTWNSAKEPTKILVATLFDSEGTKLSEAEKQFTVVGESQGPNPDGDVHVEPKPGSSSSMPSPNDGTGSSTGSAKGFFQQIIDFLANFFKKLFAGGGAAKS